jgi:Ca-activated chloride channel family protein
LNRLRDVKAKSKIIILMTDGANNSGKIDPLTAAEAAQALGIKIYTIGLGNREIVEQRHMPAAGFLPDEDTLKKIAQMTGGQFYRGDNSEKLANIYDEIDKMEKTESVVSKYTEFTELFPWFLCGGAGLLLLEITLAQTVLRRLP